jgi:hypothetical protein
MSPEGGIQRDIWVAAVFLILGTVLAELLSRFKTVYRDRREAIENQRVDLSGTDWFAAWQASVDSEVVINTESISITQRGSHVLMHNNERSPENPRGGYLWKAALTFSHGETLMGWYYPNKIENLTSRGILFFTYDAQRRLFMGKWVGKAIDGKLCNGYACISKNRDSSLVALRNLIELAKHHPVNVLADVSVSGNKLLSA